MKSNEIKEKVLRSIHERRGTSEAYLREHFGLSHYRLKRIFRDIERDLEGSVLAHDPERGVWIVEIDGSRCSGMNWVGEDEGGFRQCGETVLFPDSRCYDYSH